MMQAQTRQCFKLKQQPIEMLRITPLPGIAAFLAQNKVSRPPLVLVQVLEEKPGIEGQSWGSSVRHASRASCGFRGRCVCGSLGPFPLGQPLVARTTHVVAWPTCGAVLYRPG